MRRVLRMVFVAALLAFVPARASADVRCPTPPGTSPELSQIDGAARLAFIRRVLDDQGPRATTWSTAWKLAGVGLIGGSIAFFVLAPTAQDRTDSIVGSITSTVIPLSLDILPLRVMGDARTLAALMDAPNAAADTCVILAAAERFLERDAEDEAFGTGWLPHTVTIVGNAAIGLTLGIGYGYWKGALLNGAGGIAIGEARILTQPTGAVDAWKRYKRGELAASSRATRAHIRVVPLSGAFGAALSITY